MLTLVGFVNQLVSFFEELTIVFPEERDIRVALDAVKAARRVNPRLLVDLFYEHVYASLYDYIKVKDINTIQAIAREKIQTQFNEIMPAIAIFDKHWDTMSESTRDAIWKYLLVLCVLCEKARNNSGF